MESGRMIKRLWWNGADGDASKSPKESQHMVTLSELHGEYDMDWVLLVDSKTGREIERHNVRYIASIEWSDK